MMSNSVQNAALLLQRVAAATAAPSAAPPASHAPDAGVPESGATTAAAVAVPRAPTVTVVVTMTVNADGHIDLRL